jgi:olefin beta-lactone synthetase
MKNIAYESIGFQQGIQTGNNVISFLLRHRELFPERIALKWISGKATCCKTDALQHDSITFGLLAHKIGCIAGGLRALGLIPGDRVLIFLPMSPELYLAMFGVLQIGAVAVFLDSWARKDQLGLCSKTAGPKAVISLEAAFTMFGMVPEVEAIPLKIVAGSHTGTYDADLSSLSEAPSESPIEPVYSGTPALITFTTGSSGTPKGAVRTHQFLAAQHKALDACITYAEDDSDLPTFPIFSLNNLAAGITTVLPAIDLASPSPQDPCMIARQITSARVTCCTLSPSILINLAEYCRTTGHSLSGLARIVTGGAPISKEDIAGIRAAAPGSEIRILYGSTEVEPIASVGADEILNNDGREGVLVGTISADLDFRFIRIHREPVELKEDEWKDWDTARGEIGELLVSGPHVCQEYYNNPAAFMAAKIRERTGKIWHRTGDLGFLDEGDRLWLVGRVHNAIMRQGRYLFPVRAERLLRNLHFVRQAAYVGMADPLLGEKACAVISLHQGYDPSALALYKEEVSRILREQGIPLDDIRVLDEIPMDPRHHSKVEYSRLKNMLGK